MPRVGSGGAQPRSRSSHAEDEPVALVLAAQVLDGATGTELLGEARRLHPHAKRALLIGWGDWGDASDGRRDLRGDRPRAASTTTSSGRSAPPDELFHHAISSFLLEWAEAQRIAPYTIHVVGDSWSGRAYELRERARAVRVPAPFSLADSAEGARSLERRGAEAAPAARRLARRHGRCGSRPNARSRGPRGRRSTRSDATSTS